MKTSCQARGIGLKKGLKKGAFKAPFQLFRDRIDGTAVDACTALGAVVGDGVGIAGLDNSPERAGVDAGSAGDTFFGNLESHINLLCLVG
jgi:hypothetical protein